MQKLRKHRLQLQRERKRETEGKRGREKGMEWRRGGSCGEKKLLRLFFLILQNQLGKKKLEMHTHSSYAQAGRHTNPTPVDLVSREGIFCFCLCLKVLKFKAAAIA